MHFSQKAHILNWTMFYGTMVPFWPISCREWTSTKIAVCDWMRLCTMRLRVGSVTNLKKSVAVSTNRRLFGRLSVIRFFYTISFILSRKPLFFHFAVITAFLGFAKEVPAKQVKNPVKSNFFSAINKWVKIDNGNAF